MVDYINKIKNLIYEKRKSISDEIDLKKISTIEECLKDENCFFKLEPNALINMLKFIDMPENEIKEFYSWLLSPETIENYRKKFYRIEEEKNR